MEDISEELPKNHNLKCHVCGENKFEVREGFYYCQECGTKQDQVRLVEIEQDDEFDQDKPKTKKQKICAAKSEKPQLTSWECYNYILRGFVEELLSFGGKEELKLMTLQVWAAYLRRMQAAFFNRRQPDLPKLGIKYLENDAQTIYNHSKQARKRRRGRRSEDASFTSGGDSKSARNWNKSKRKLDESNYSMTSLTSGLSGLTSTTSGNSNKAIKIHFNNKAKAYYKRKMPVKHVEKHAGDAEGKLTCHKQPRSREINRTDYSLMLVSIKQIYSILAIALNLVGDEIQLSDLVRFIYEGHIGTSNVLQYFPENIAINGKEMLKKIKFSKFPEKYSDNALRDHVGIICKNIGIQPKKPDIIKLVRRYITELCLPTHIADYIERLINLLPPQFNTRAVGQYPGYEARAMAYIIFTLKLLFGLDGSKEHRISRTSKNINSKIEMLNQRKNENQPLVFVWTDWVEYIEMRKIIVSQFNNSFCKQFKQSQNANQLLEEMAEEMRRTEEDNILLNDTSENQNIKQKLKNFRSFFERFQETYNLSEKDKKPPQRIKFAPSLTPAYAYLKSILLAYSEEETINSSINVEIPAFMRIDHSRRDINSYLQVKPLMAYFRRHQLKLDVHVLPTTENKSYIGVFRSSTNNDRLHHQLYKAYFEVTEEEWGEMVEENITKNKDDLEFRTDLNTYKIPPNTQKLKREAKRKACFDPNMTYKLTMIQGGRTDQGENEKMPERNMQCNNSVSLQDNSIATENTVDPMLSFELFSENNMEPIESQDFITEPRRNLENIDIFEGISDEESVLNDDDGADANLSDEFSNELSNGMNSLLTSGTPIFEEFIKVEPVSPNERIAQNESTTKMSEEKIDKSSKSNDALKMYISNMDCWMILGSILMLNKLKRTQLQDKFPRSFNWLLETCAQTINVEWSAVYEQLLCIETMFCLGINDPQTITNCVYMNSHHPFKEIQMILTTYREIW